MKKIFIVGVLGMGFMNWLTGCASNSSPESISAGELLREMQSGNKPYIVDVREQDELHGPLHILPGAKSIPLTVFSQRFTEIPKDQRVFLVCHSGRRSSKALAILKKHGYTQAVNVEGGMLAVQAAQAK